MDKREIYDSIGDVESDIQQILARVSQLKAEMREIIEKNATLELENQHLRAQMLERKPEISKSRLNLGKLYDEGFHVCNPFYGTRRENDEDCAFCLEVIYRKK